MLQKTKTYNCFSEHLTLLNQLATEGNENYVQIQKKIKLFKELGFPLIGNPLFGLLNEQIKSNYFTFQHIENCKLYMTLLSDQANERDAVFIDQLIGLIKISRELRCTNLDIKNRYQGYLKEEFKIRKLNYTEDQAKVRI